MLEFRDQIYCHTWYFEMFQMWQQKLCLTGEYPWKISTVWWMHMVGAKTIHAAGTTNGDKAHNSLRNYSPCSRKWWGCSPTWRCLSPTDARDTGAHCSCHRCCRRASWIHVGSDQFRIEPTAAKSCPHCTLVGQRCPPCCAANWL